MDNTQKRVFKKIASESFAMREEFEHDFLMGRMHLTTQTKLSTKLPSFEKSISKLLKDSVLYRETNKWKSIWVFGNMGEVLFEEEKMHYGIFGRVKDRGIEEVYIPETKIFKKEYIEQLIKQSSALFIINPKTQIIIFEEKLNISHKKFIKMFERVYNDFYKQKTTLTIDLLQEKTKLEDLEKKKIIKITFNLKPSNPDTGKDFKIIDSLLQKAKAKTADISIQNENEGLNLESAGLARQGLALSGAGYGDYKAVVEEDHNRKTISSKDNILREKISLPKFSIDVIFEVLKRFKKYKGEKK